MNRPVSRGCRPLFPGGCETYGLFAPGYQDLTADAVFCPYRGVQCPFHLSDPVFRPYYRGGRLNPIPHGCETYGLFAPFPRGAKPLRSLCPGLPRFDRSAVFCPYRGWICPVFV